jgi:DNA-binding CsgD family transcriptional regulator
MWVWHVPDGIPLLACEKHANMCVAWSPDGALLASSGSDHTIEVLDVRTWQRLSTLRGHSSWVRSIAFSSDGKTLASASDDQSIKLWDVRAGECLSTLQGHAGYVYSVAFSPDGALLASGSQDESIKLWDFHTGQCLSTLQGHTNVVLSVAFSPTSALLASGSQDGTIKLWERRTGRSLSTLRGERPYERLNISGVTGLSEAEKASLRALGAKEQSAEPFEKSRQDRDQSPIEPLSEREREVLRLVAQGATGQQIAQQLGIAVSTVKTYLKGIYRKLHVHSRAQAVACAAQLTLL